MKLTESPRCVRADQSPGAGALPGAGAPQVPQGLLGTWVNTNAEAQGLVRLVLAMREGRLRARVFGASEPGPHDWGEVEAFAFAEDVCSTEVAGIGLHFDFGFMETDMQAHVKQGVLVVAKFDRFKDGSGRFNRFSREFFYRAEA